MQLHVKDRDKLSFCDISVAYTLNGTVTVISIRALIKQRFFLVNNLVIPFRQECRIVDYAWTVVNLTWLSLCTVLVLVTDGQVERLEKFRNVVLLLQNKLLRLDSINVRLDSRHFRE